MKQKYTNLQETLPINYVCTHSGQEYGGPLGPSTSISYLSPLPLSTSITLPLPFHFHFHLRPIPSSTSITLPLPFQFHFHFYLFPQLHFHFLPATLQVYACADSLRTWMQSLMASSSSSSPDPAQVLADRDPT